MNVFRNQPLPLHTCPIVCQPFLPVKSRNPKGAEQFLCSNVESQLSEGSRAAGGHSIALGVGTESGVGQGGEATPPRPPLCVAVAQKRHLGHTRLEEGAQWRQCSLGALGSPSPGPTTLLPGRAHHLQKRHVALGLQLLATCWGPKGAPPPHCPLAPWGHLGSIQLRPISAWSSSRAPSSCPGPPPTPPPSLPPSHT